MAVIPYIIVRDAAAALDFYARAFGAEEAFRLTDPGGRIGHAQMTIGGDMVMLADEHPEWGAVSPTSLGGTPVSLHLSVADADASAERAVAAGATLLRTVEDQFHGSRSGMVADPYGHKWMLSQETETVSPEEMQRRYERLLAGEEA
ncbi:MAG TPA: VOC family protein [Allosphingosinicella sp.]|nr:VOC family protein [Allosphingosinicella sp.]